MIAKPRAGRFVKKCGLCKAEKAVCYFVKAKTEEKNCLIRDVAQPFHEVPRMFLPSCLLDFFTVTSKVLWCILDPSPS